MARDEIYGITINDKRLNRKKILILVLTTIAIIGIIMVSKNSTQTLKMHKVYNQYEAQIESLAKQEEYKKEDKKEQKQEELPKLTNEAKEKIKNIYQSEKKQVFLTFDDGPSTVTPNILDTLKKENVKATFFVLGYNVRAMPDTVKRIYQEGHYIANHGNTHSYSAIYSSPQAVLDEFNECNKAVQEAIEVPEYHSHLFRFPGGLVGGKYANIKSEAKELLLQNDIIHIDWNALTGDAETANPTIEFELQRLEETINNKTSVVILMHDAQAKAVTAESLPQIITTLKERGYEFKNFYEIMK